MTQLGFISERERRMRSGSSNVLMILVFGIVILEIISVGFLAYTLYSNSEYVNVNVIAVGCDVIVAPKGGEQVMVYDLQSETIKVPSGTNVTFYAILEPGSYIVSWYESGAGAGGATFQNDMWTIVSSDGTIAVAANRNLSVS